MNTTSTVVAVGLALVVAVGFLFMGPRVFTPFGTATVTPTTPAADATTQSGDTTTTTAGAQPAAGQEAIATNTYTPPIMDTNTLPTQLSIKDEVVGTGAEAKAGTNVTVNYVGSLPDGTVFDASKNHGQPFTFALGAGQVIKGWDQGVVGMKVGGKRILIVPPADGYGAQAVGSIPPNSTLIFEVELLDVK